MLVPFFGEYVGYHCPKRRKQRDCGQSKGRCPNKSQRTGGRLKLTEKVHDLV